MPSASRTVLYKWSSEQLGFAESKDVAELHRDTPDFTAALGRATGTEQPRSQRPGAQPGDQASGLSLGKNSPLDTSPGQLVSAEWLGRQAAALGHPRLDRAQQTELLEQAHLNP